MSEEVFEVDETKDAKRAIDADVARGVEYELPADFEDEEIDDDEAFDDADEAAFGSYFAKKVDRAAGTRLTNPKDGAKLLSDMLDSDSEDGAEDVESEDESSAEDELSEEDEDGDVVELVDKLARANDKEVVLARKKERTEGVKEGQYNIPSKSGGDVTMENIIESLGRESARFGDLKKKLGKLGKTKKIAAPSASIVETRAERKAGYEQSKVALSKWSTIVQENRQAKSISFPLDAAKHIKSTTASLNATFEAKTELEREIQEALEKSGLAGDKQVEEQENSDLMELTEDPADVIKRRGELSKLRALMFYDEQKSKRQKKIKSKVYRKLKKRRTVREEEKHEEEIRRLDPEAAQELGKDMYKLFSIDLKRSSR